jgi:hypothetical protein
LEPGCELARDGSDDAGLLRAGPSAKASSVWRLGLVEQGSVWFGVMMLLLLLMMMMMMMLLLLLLLLLLLMMMMRH